MATPQPTVRRLQYKLESKKMQPSLSDAFRCHRVNERLSAQPMLAVLKPMNRNHRRHGEQAASNDQGEKREKGWKWRFVKHDFSNQTI